MENTTKLNKTGKKELFDYGITSINNKEWKYFMKGLDLQWN